MSDVYPLPKNIPQGPDPNALPPAQGVAQQMPDLAKRVSSLTTSPNYQALKGPASFGAAGLPGALQLAGSVPGASGLIGGLGGLAATGAASLAAPAALAYGAGKLIAPKWTDETVGKIKDFISSKFAPAIQKAGEIGSAQEVGMAEAVPGSRFVEKNVLPQQVNDYLTQIKNQHPEAALMGKLSGSAALMALPGVNAIEGAGLGSTIGNAAINAAPFAVGTGLDVGATTGDVGKGVLAGAGAEALGTALPAAVYGLSKVPAVSRWLTKVQLAGADIKTSDAARNLRSYAMHTLGLRGPAVDSYVASHAEPLEQKLGGLVDQFGQGRAGKEAMREWNDAGFEAHNSAYEAVTGNHVTTDVGSPSGMSDADHVLADPDLVEEVAGNWTPEQIQEAVQRIGKKIDGQSWNRSRNNILQNIMEDGKNAKGQVVGTGNNVLDAHVAQAWHNQIDSIADRAMGWAKTGELGPEAQAAAADVPELTTLKSTYPAIQSIKRAQAREEPLIPRNYDPGSGTFIRAATEAALTGTMGPAGALASHFAGPIIAKVAGKGLEKGSGALAGGFKNLLKNVPDLTGAGRAAVLGAPLAQQMNGPTNPTGETMGGPSPEQAAAPAPEPAPAPAPAGAAPIPNAPMGQPAPTPVISPQDQAQQDFKQAGQEPTKVGKWNDSAVEARIDEKYSRYVRQYGQSLTRDQYKQAFINTTHGMDPTLPDTWKAMFDDPATSEKMYNAYMGLQKLGSNVDKTVFSGLNHYTSYYLPLGKRLESSRQFEENEDNAKLVDTLSKMTGQPAKDIDKRLHDIAWNRSLTPKQRKQAVVDMMVNEGGVNAPLLIQMGLWGG